MSYDIEAENEGEAETKAFELFDEDILKSISDSGCADCFGVNVEELDAPPRKTET